MKLTIADHAILLLALLLVSGSYLHYWWDKPQRADYAIIIAFEQKPLRVNLRKPQEIHVQGRLGESVLKISNGKIRFTHSACQRKSCIHAGWLTKGGDFIACLPNQVSVAVYGKNSLAIDSVAY